MYPILKQLMAACCCILLLTYLVTGFALKEDRQEKVHVVADSIIYNYKVGINTYEGHIKVDQGTTHITGDRLITKNNALHKIEEATVYGLQSLAHYWTLPEKDQPEVDAHAKVIRFHPADSSITLEKNVTITQGENRFQGELIHYNKKDQIIIVPASRNARAVIVYNPDSSKNKGHH